MRHKRRPFSVSTYCGVSIKYAFVDDWAFVDCDDCLKFRGDNPQITPPSRPKRKFR